MTDNQRTALRSCLLVQLHHSGGNGLVLDMLHQGQKLNGLNHTLPEVMTEIDYLEELGHLRKTGLAFNASQKTHRLTEAGRIALTEAGLI